MKRSITLISVSITAFSIVLLATVLYAVRARPLEDVAGDGDIRRPRNCSSRRSWQPQPRLPVHGSLRRRR